MCIHTYVHTVHTCIQCDDECCQRFVVSSVDCSTGVSLCSLDQQEMSEEHRRYLTLKQFEAGIVTDDKMLENLRNMQALRYEEFRQIRSQLTMDQRREKLFDTLKRKPDHRFTLMETLFDNYSNSKNLLLK